MARRPPRLAYLVCSTPRSGSTLLCETLRHTGVLGSPLEHFERLRETGLPRQPREFFLDLDPQPAWVDRLAPLEPGTPSDEAPEAWWQRILEEGSGPNGVWGGKLMWVHIEDLVARARELPDCTKCDLAAIMEHLLGDARIIFMTREDKVAQAVSLWKALQTRSWRATGDGQDAAVEPAYDADAIAYITDELERRDNRWRRWFHERGKAHHTVTYSELTTDFTGTITRVVDFLGQRGAEVGEPPVQRQADGLSRAWIDRFHADRPVTA